MDLRQAIDIERLLTWALRDQGLGWDSKGVTTGMERYAQLGTVISGGMVADPSVSLLSDTDAIVVRQSVDRLPREARGLVIQHGRTGTRPEGADEPIGEPQQLRNKRGQLRWEYENHKQAKAGKGQRKPLLDILAWSEHQAGVTFSRAQWTLWREGLAALVEPLNGEMEHHRATGPAAPAEPWAVARPVIHGASQFEPSTEPQPWLKGERPAVRPDRSRTVEQLRHQAQDQVRTVAADWGTPLQPIKRKKLPAEAK